MTDSQEDTFVLICDALRNILETIDDPEELHQMGMELGGMFDMQEGVIEAIRNGRHDEGG